MDFQYDGPRPVDPSSPFSRMTNALPQQELPAKKSELLFYHLQFARLTLTPPPLLKGPLSIFQSSTPSKLPTLTPPASQPFLFAKTPYQTPQPSRPPPPFFRTPSTTLRRPAFDMSDLSNDPDIFSTPPAAAAVRVESPHSPEDLGTPNTLQTPFRTSRPVVFTAAAGTPGRITGRGEIPRGRYHDGAITKVRRRRQSRLPFRITDEDLDSDSDYDLERVPSPPDWKSHASVWVATHRDLPLIASQYLQLMFNLSLIMLLLYAVFCFYLTIRHDVDKKVSEFSSTILAEMSLCQRRYVENRCAPDMRVPAMEATCGSWEKCMTRDPAQVGRARVSAETFAEIINSFIEPISYKTMVCPILTFCPTAAPTRKCRKPTLTTPPNSYSVS